MRQPGRFYLASGYLPKAIVSPPLHSMERGPGGEVYFLATGTYSPYGENSTAPMSQAAPRGRRKPRSSLAMAAPKNPKLFYERPNSRAFSAAWVRSCTPSFWKMTET